MKERFMKVCALLLAVIVIVCAVPNITVEAAPLAGAQGTQPSTYSKEYNSGQRDVWCTTLSGTSASSYYTGNYTYEKLSSLSASSLKSSLSTLMRSTHENLTSYSDCHYKANRTDCENENGRVTLIYTSYSATMDQWNGWNREHVWPKSLGGKPLGKEESEGGSDLHHLRPSDQGVNSSRGNKPYGNAGSGASSKYGSDPAVGVLGGTYNSTYYEPLDNVKGDVARICLYVYVRWGSDWGADSITEVFQSVDVLLEWCELDPVDTWEMGRNEVVQSIQGNRNVFIDYPEFAWLIFGEEVPDDMVTPSGRASNGTAGGNGGSGSGSGNSGSTTESEKETETTPSQPANTGSLAAPLTTTEAYNINKSLASGTASNDKFYVRGRITKIGEAGSYYKNVYISDGTTEVLIYTLNLSSGMSGIEIGDTITAYGYFKNFNGTIEMASNSGTYVYVVAIESQEGGGGSSESEKPTETEKPTDTEKPTEPETQPGTGSGENREATLSFASKANRTQFSDTIQVWEQNGIVLTNNKDKSQTKVGDYAGPLRLYQGSLVTIAADGMTKIVIQCNTTAYATELVNSLAGISGITVSQNTKVVTITFSTPTDSLTFSCAKQIRFDSLTATCGASGSSGSGSGNETETDKETETETETETEKPPVQSGNGTLEAPLSATQAYNANKNLATGTASADAYYVKGTITKIGESGSYYKNVYISDGTTEVLIYTLNLSNGISGIKVGDTVTVYGYFKNYNGTIEMATNGSTYVQVVKLEAGNETETETGGNNTETETVPGTNTETENGGSVETETGVNTETENGGSVETETGVNTDTENGGSVETEIGSDIETDTAGGNETESTSTTQAESSAVTETQTATATDSSGCKSSIAGGAISITVVSILALVSVRKKKED